SRDPRIGTELLGYRVEELVGRGGMGVVYRAYDPRLKRNVALKLIAPELSGDERFRERFLAETELAASLEHPNVLPIHDAGEVGEQLYLVMRYLEGSDVQTLLRQHAALAPVFAKALAKRPEERYGTCSELIEAASEALGIAPSARPVWSRGPVVVALALALMTAALLAFFLSRGGGPSKPSTRPTLTP